MPATTRTIRQDSRPEKALLPTPRRFLRCLACGTIKKGRSYALCAECYKRSGRLARHWFIRLAREAEREAPLYSYRVHPEFDKARRIYARRRQRAKATARIDARGPRKIRYHDHEWDRVVEQARASRLPPATFVRKVSLGARPSASQGEDKLVLELGRIATELQSLARAAEYGDPPEPGQIQLILDETLTAVRKVGER